MDSYKLLNISAQSKITPRWYHKDWFASVKTLFCMFIVWLFKSKTYIADYSTDIEYLPQGSTLRLSEWQTKRAIVILQGMIEIILPINTLNSKAYAKYLDDPCNIIHNRIVSRKV